MAIHANHKAPAAEKPEAITKKWNRSYPLGSQVRWGGRVWFSKTTAYVHPDSNLPAIGLAGVELPVTLSQCHPLDRVIDSSEADDDTGVMS